MVATIDELIYRQTYWVFNEQSGDENRGIGLEIRNVSTEYTIPHIMPTLFMLLCYQVIVHTEPNLTDTSHYNALQSVGPRRASDLLQRFRFGDWEDYCLAHLFTNTAFPSGLLGLADIASPRRGETGGICSQGKQQ